MERPAAGPARPRGLRGGRISLLGALLVLGFGALGAALVVTQRTQRALAEREAWLVDLNRRLGSERAAAEAQFAASERRAEATRLALARALWRQGELAQAALELASFPTERRGWVWRHLAACLELSSDGERAPHAVLESGAGEVRGLALSPDGARLIAGGARDRLSLFELATGALEHEWSAHRRGVNCAAFAPDGRRAASSGPDLRVRVWSLDPPTELFDLGGHARPVVALAFSADGELLVAVTMAGELRVWNATSGALEFEKRGPEDGILSVAIDARAERFAWAGDGGVLRVWSALDGRKLSGLRAADLGRVSALAFAPRSDPAAGAGLMATGARFEDSPPRLWSLESAALHVRSSPERGPVRALAFDPRGELFACALEDGRVQLFDVETGAELIVLEGLAGVPTDIAFDPKGERLFVGGPGAAVQVWDSSAARHLELVEALR